jgi:hypothetical protein
VLLDHPCAVADHVAEFALRCRRHKAAAEQAEFKQLGEPLTVANNGLALGHRLHVLRVHHGQLEARLDLAEGQDAVQWHSLLGHTLVGQRGRLWPSTLSDKNA